MLPHLRDHLKIPNNWKNANLPVSNTVLKCYPRKGIVALWLNVCITCTWPWVQYQHQKKGDIRRNFLLLLVPEYFLDNRLNNTLHIEYDLRRKNDLAPNVLILDWTN